MTTIFKALENTEKEKSRHGIKSSITHPHTDNPTDTLHCLSVWVYTHKFSTMYYLDRSQLLLSHGFLSDMSHLTRIAR